MNVKHALKWFKRMSLEEMDNFADEAQPIYIKKEEEEKMNILDCQKAVPCAIPIHPAQKISSAMVAAVLGNVVHETQKQEKGSAMYYEIDPRDEEQRKTDYLAESLKDEMNRKDTRLLKAFGLTSDIPTTIGEMKEFIAKGWVTIGQGDEYDDDYEINYPSNYLVFHNPEIKRDSKGYNEAVKAMRAEASDVKDAIIVLGPAKGLEALNAFKAKTFH